MTLNTYNEVKEELIKNPHTWLITGVAGFIGSNLLEELLSLNQKVIGIDNFSTGSKANLEDVLSSLTVKQQQNFSFYQGDICSLSDCQKVIKGVEYVLHQAALGSVPRSIKTPEITHDNNVNGFLNILIAAKEEKVKRFVFASSSSIYGDSPDLPKVEEKTGAPLSPYAVTKITNELYAQAFSKCYPIETIGLRYFNVFGPRQNPNGMYAAVIPLWISALLKHENVYANGDGETTRDFCYVANAVQANILAATTKNPDAINTVYNIAVGQQNSLKKLHELIVTELNIPKQVLHFREFRSGDIRHSLANINKAAKLLGYSPTHTLHQGLKLMLNCHNKAVLS